MSGGHVGDLLERWARTSPDRAAIVAPDGTTRTFGELRRAAVGVAARLDALGCGPHVLLLVPVGVPLYELLLGVMWGGRTVVLVDPSVPPDRLDPALANVGLDAFVGVPKAHLLRLKLRSLRGLGLYGATRSLGPFARKVGSGPGEAARRDPSEGEPALITFTTGTTGVPKAMGRSHAFLLAQHDVLNGHMGLGPDDVDLPTLPVFLLNSLACGATCVLPDGDLRDVASFDPARLTDQATTHRVTTSSGSPAFYAPWARWLVERGQAVPSMRRLFVGGARVSAGLLDDLVVAFPNARIEVLYGSTEAEPMASIEARDALRLDATGVGSCVGAPVDGLAVRLVDPDTGHDVDGDGVGEVWVAGGHVNVGYYRNPAADAETKVRDGGRVWHKTGDAAWRDELGRLWLMGRVSQRVGGRYPFPVEAKAERVPGVEKAALVELDGAAVLAVQGPADLDAVRVATGVADVRRLPVVPVDPRHRAKVDVPAVIAALRRTGG